MYAELETLNATIGEFLAEDPAGDEFDAFMELYEDCGNGDGAEALMSTWSLDNEELTQYMADLKGFHTQEVALPQQKAFHSEMVNGRQYKCVTWSQYVMYPQMTGKLEIPSITFKGLVVQQNRNVDPMEAFFNGGSGYVEVHKDIKAPGMTINVLPLPSRPANFSGGVGKFNISASIDKKEVKAGDPVTIRVVVGGVGNLKLLKQPVVTLPKDFDKYDAKITDKTRLTSNGVEGNMVYDFLVVPRNQGSYKIPPVEFTYYDTSSNSYKTIKTQAFDLTVSKGDGSTGGSQDYVMALPLKFNTKIGRDGVGLGDIANIFAYAGPQFGFNIGGKNDSFDERLDNVNNWRFKDSNLSGNVGVGVTLLKHLQASVNYNFAIGKTGDFDSVGDAIDNIDKKTVKAKANAWQVSLAYFF